MDSLHDQLRRWREGGVLDAATARRIELFEAAHPRPRSRWPARLALAFGALMVGAGVLLFVAAHWDRMSPLARFGTALALVGGFHALGSLAALRLPSLATALHGIGTAALGAGIFLGGQIFNLSDRWPGGVLLWAAGAVVGALLLRDWVQIAFAALLVPAWLVSEWNYGGWVDTPGGTRAEGTFLVLLALAYLSAIRFRPNPAPRRALAWIGGLLLLPAGLYLGYAVADESLWSSGALPGPLAALGCGLAVALPIALWVALRGRAAWPAPVAVAWTAAVATLPPDSPILYALLGGGALGLVAWGMIEERRERIDLGIAAFGATVLFFYFSSMMDRLGRSAGLAGFGALFLAGGFLLERARRRIVSILPAEAP